MDDQIDRLFEQGPELPTALSDRIRAEIQRTMKPVKPMMSNGAYTLLFGAVFAVVALLFGSLHGFRGLHVLTSMEAVTALTALAVFALLSGSMAARSMRPGSGSLHSWLLGLLAFVAYEVLVIAFFRDYSTVHFVRRGLICLAFRVICGAFAAAPLWLIIRRGLVVEQVRAGAVVGLISGLQD